MKLATSTSAKARWKHAYSHLRSIANTQKDGRIEAVIAGRSITVRGIWCRANPRLQIAQTAAARRAKNLNIAIKLTSPTGNASWDDRMYRWHKDRARTHLELARENAAPSLPSEMREAA